MTIEIDKILLKERFLTALVFVHGFSKLLIDNIKNIVEVRFKF
jgi:hypothetical protein